MAPEDLKTRPTKAAVLREQTARYWSGRSESFGAGPETWFQHDAVRRYVNRSVSGKDDGWPLDWLEDHLGGERFGRVLSAGCGRGALERDLLRRGLCERVDAFDVSLGALARARSQAAAEGVGDRIHYFALDANAPALPPAAYDAVFCHQFLHHVAKLEKLFRCLLRTLRPGALLYADEVVGPSRTEWSDDALASAAAAYQELVPPEVRRIEPLPAPIDPFDPSEAVRSSEILPQLEIGFEIEAVRPYGGNILSLVCPHVDWSRASPRLVEDLIAREQEHLAHHGGSHCAVVVARPKGGWPGRWASARYFVEPKLKRVGRELRGLFRPADRTGAIPLAEDTDKIG